MQAQQTPVLSLDAPRADGKSQLGDVMPDETTLPPSEAARLAERAAQIEQCLQALTPREQAIVRARFGLDDGQEHTLEELGQELQLSRSGSARSRRRRSRSSATRPACPSCAAGLTTKHGLS